ncbi:MAG: hypothetical protein ACK5SP_01785 [bacterium]|jgi:hypothetical protein
MAYTRGTSNNIIVGAAALFTYEDGVLPEAGVLPGYSAGVSYKTTLSDEEGFRNVGYTMNGLELQFQPDFGEVSVDQVLDVAKLFKQGMQVNLNTTFAESTLENLLFALASKDENLTTVSGNPTLNLSAGDIGECPVERGLVAVGPGTGDCAASDQIERVYVAYRALSIESVTVGAKRDEATMFEVSFRLLPNDNGSYGKIVDRTIPA